jgi:mannose/fructose/N-acetylgalactosamine-specific phosphotransferase system component IID
MYVICFAVIVALCFSLWYAYLFGYRKGAHKILDVISEELDASTDEIYKKIRESHILGMSSIHGKKNNKTQMVDPDQPWLG